MIQKANRGLSRREFLTTVSAAAVAAGIGRGLTIAGDARAQGTSGLVPYPDMFAANQPRAWTEKDSRRGGELVFAHVSDPPHLNPLLTTSYSMLAATGPVYSRLIRPKGGDYDDPFDPELVPDLAESWEITDQGKTIRFKLRQGVKWHNTPPVSGQEFTTEDVRATFEAWSNGVTAFLSEPAERLETPSKYEVILRLKEPNVAFFP